jgi:uncharacterized membrane protein
MIQKRLPLIFLALFSLLTLYAVLSILTQWPYYSQITEVSTILGCLFALMHAIQTLGKARAFLLAVIVFLVGLAFESIGVATGAVYGPYHYSDLLGPKFLGLVPYIIPAAWFMMMYPSMVIAEMAFPVNGTRSWANRLLVSAIGGFAMTSWDLVMDPLMVRGGHWVWEIQGPYFGIPLQNFVGWWATTFTAILLFYLVSSMLKPERADSEKLSPRWALALYCVTGSSSIMSGLLVGLGGAALVGFFAMLPWVLFAWMKKS